MAGPGAVWGSTVSGPAPALPPPSPGAHPAVRPGARVERKAFFMRRYDEPVDVRRRDETPTEFLWRGRLYVVRDVYATWIETDPWWLAPSARGVYGQTSGDATFSEGVAPVPVSETAEREMWRVEASGGRAAGCGVFDLCFDWSAGLWRLAQVVD